MKKLLAVMAVALMFAFAGASTASAQTTSQGWSTVCGNIGAGGCTNPAAGDPASGIVYSRHNLSSLGEHWQAHTSEALVSGGSAEIKTTQICVFCHTPHHTNTGKSGPLWQREDHTGFTTYTSKFPAARSNAGLGGYSLTTSGASLSCLSCHDATTAVDMMINAPGKGSYTDSLSRDAGWGFYDAGNYKGDKLSGRLNIGTNLANDHPVGMAYPTISNPAGIFSLRPKTTSFSSAGPMDNANSSIYGRSDNMWSVNGYICSSCSIQDVLKGTAETVECGSCHDPHYKNNTNTDPGVIASYGATGNPDKDIDGLFLRRVGGNSNSGVCRTCHAK